MATAPRAKIGWQTSALEDSLVTQLSWAKQPEPVRELSFHPVRKWRFDLAWPEHHLAVEVQGSTFAAGAHTRGKGYEADCVKHNEAVLLGWRVLVVTGAMVDDGRALATIEQALAAS